MYEHLEDFENEKEQILSEIRHVLDLVFQVLLDNMTPEALIYFENFVNKIDVPICREYCNSYEELELFNDIERMSKFIEINFDENEEENMV